MRLYLLRHADADPGHPDATRPLSAQGLQDLDKLVRLLRRKKAVQAEKVWRSPLLRAEQTTDLFLAGLDQAWPVEVKDHLAPEGNPARTARALLEAQEHLLVVGHNPHLELLASYLLTGRSNGAMVLLGTSTLLAFESTEIRPDIGSCLLRWMLTPKILRGK